MVRLSTIAQNHVATGARLESEGNGLPYEGELSHHDLEALAELTARRLLCVGAEEAFAMLDRGDLAGTHSESTLLSLRWLLDAK